MYAQEKQQKVSLSQYRKNKEQSMKILEGQEKSNFNKIKSKTYNPYNISRNINTKIRKPICDLKKYKPIFKRVSKNIFISKKKITEPLFLIKLHSQLSQISDHLTIFRQITDKAKIFIDQELKESHQYWQRIKDSLYIQKFQAFQYLLDYLRITNIPDKDIIVSYLKYGIYGNSKHKYTKKIDLTVQKCIKLYQPRPNLIVGKI